MLRHRDAVEERLAPERSVISGGLLHIGDKLWAHRQEGSPFGPLLFSEGVEGSLHVGGVHLDFEFWFLVSISSFRRDRTRNHLPGNEIPSV